MRELRVYLITLVVAFVFLVAVVMFGVTRAGASTAESWHQQTRVATRHCPRFGGCSYTYQDVGYVSNDGAVTVSSAVTGPIDAGSRSRTLQLAHGTTITFDDGTTVTA